MKEKILSVLHGIINIILELLLSLFYLCCFICIIAGAFYIYSNHIKQPKLILKVEKSLSIQDIGDKISLPVKDDININQLIYDIEDKNIVLINEEGKIIAKSEGITVVTISTNDNKKTQTILIGVGDAAAEQLKDEDYVDNLLTEAKENQKETND